jgi:hypothetical protein
MGFALWVCLVGSAATTAGGITITSPVPGTIVQRGNNGAFLTIAGVAGRAGVLRARVVPASGDRPSRIGWVVVGRRIDGPFSVRLPVKQGWWHIELSTGRDVARVGPVGVGEVFICAGQSNSANHGAVPLPPTNPQVQVVDRATGTGGNPWGVCGDILAQRLGVPIKLISVGYDGSRADSWLPGHEHYHRLEEALELAGPGGIRAILWHQGESDSLSGTSTTAYVATLLTIIRATGQRWFVARAGYTPVSSPTNNAAVLKAQIQLADQVTVFPGPYTDDLIGPFWRVTPPGFHFTEEGLMEHGRRWAEAILATLPR